MKLIILQENLSRCLTVAGHFIPSHSSLPILSNFLLTAEKNRLQVSATDSEIGINYYCGAKIEKEGKIAIPARIFGEFISSLPADKINLKLDKETLKVACGNFKADFPTISPLDFPKIPTTSSQKLTLPLALFLDALKGVIFAASNDGSRPVLEGVRFKLLGKQCLLESTDGYRLSQKRIILEKDQKDLEFIIPANVLKEIIKLKMEGKWLEVGLSKGIKQAVFLLPDMEISSRLLEGNFPDIDQVIPSQKEASVLLDREEFQNAIRVASIFARESANIVKMEIGDGEIKISANSPQVGENKSSIEAKTEGEPQKIAFNCRFLLDFLQTIESKEILMELNGSLSPAVFKIPDDKSFLHIIMPVRLQEEE